jgi:hypothetical protein
MAGKRYSAGAIFLQVVPVFANVQRAIEDEAKTIDRALGDQMERSGEKAGERAGKAASKRMAEEIKRSQIGADLEREVLAGVDNIERALASINTKNLGKKLRAEVKGMREDLDTLKSVDLNVDDNLDKVRDRLTGVRSQIEDMRKRSGVFFDIKGLPEAYRGLAKLQTAIDAVDGNIDLDVDTKAADRKIGAFERKFKATTKRAAEALSSSVSKEARKVADELNYLSNLRIGIDISSTMARRELAEISADLKRLEKEAPEIDLRVDSGIALAELVAFEKALDAIDKRDVEAKVKTNAKQAGHDADQAANSFRSFNIILLGAVSIGPALIPVLAGIAGGLLAIGPAAAVAVAGLGAVLVGFSGLGDALSALQNQQDQAATNAQTNAGRQVSAARAIENAQEALSDARRNAARAAEDAADRVKEAREAAAEAIEDALERQKDAQEEYRDAVNEVADAEQALRDAREEARKDAESLAKRQRQNAVDERQAVLDLFEAQTQFNAVMADGSSTDTDKEQASVNLEQAQIALNDTRDEQVALAEEAADYAKNGVDGSEKVKSAQDELTEALEAQKDAQEELREAAEAADEARVEGAERVREALEDQREILSDNARAIQRAKENLSDARQSAVDDLSQINAQQQAVNAAFDKLGPAGRKFALFLFGLKSGFYEFRDAVQQAMLPAVQKAIEGFIASPAADKARGAFVALAAAFGDFALALSKSFQGPAWSAFFEMLAEHGPAISKAYGDAFISVMEAFASVLVVSAPFAKRFAEGLAGMMDGFARWASSKQGAQDIKDFIAYVEEIGPKVLDFFFGLAGAVINLAKGMAPFGEVVLGLVDGFLDFVAKMDTGTLGAIATAMTVILLASQVAYAIMNLSMSLGALFATTIGPWIFLIIAAGAALVYLYQTNEDFRKFVTDAWERISKVLKKSWEEDIKPALTELWDALKLLWKDVLQPFLEWLGPVVLWMFEELFPLWAKRLSFYIRAVAWIIKKVIVPAFKEIRDEVKFGWEKVIKPTWEKLVRAAGWVKDKAVAAFDLMKTGWNNLKTGVVNGWNRIKEIWDIITDTALPAFKIAFETTIDQIGKLWDGLKALVGTPLKFVIEKVINGGLIDGFNKVSGWVNGPKIDHVPIPEALQSYATGGVLPGYTPGRDVHQFVSPTAGRLELSGGEAIMRPEWTAAMGPAYVNQMNALARRGGVGAIRKALGGSYWMGGILPLANASVASHGNSYPYPAFDLNYPGYADYGKPVLAFRDGIITAMRYLGDTSYGRYVTINHGDSTSLYAHLSSFANGLMEGMAVRAGATIGAVGDIGNTGTPPSSHLHFEIRGGNPSIAAAGNEPDRPSIPSWIMGFVRDPLGGFQKWITDPLKNASSSFADAPWFESVKKTPAMLGKKVVDKAWDIIPGWVKTAAGWAGEATDWVVGGVKNIGKGAVDLAGDVANAATSGVKNSASAVADFLGFAEGGILPYNGTMMYDAGGYLQPGLTTVMNLTGKPEPVFTADQFDDLSVGGGDGFTYAPTFNGTDLTAADVVDDLDFTSRKIRREGRYGRNQ